MGSGEFFVLEEVKVMKKLFREPAIPQRQWFSCHVSNCFVEYDRYVLGYTLFPP